MRICAIFTHESRETALKLWPTASLPESALKSAFLPGKIATMRKYGSLPTSTCLQDCKMAYFEFEAVGPKRVYSNRGYF